MIITKTIEFDLFQENIKYLSTDDLGNYIAVTSKNRIVTPGIETPLDLGGNIVMAKIIDEEKILVVIDRPATIENALIIDYSENCKVKFNIGTSINDIKVNGKKIMVSYFDEGILNGEQQIIYAY